MTKPTKKLIHWDNGNIEIEAYRVDGKLHRTDGPAYIRYYEDGNIESESYLVDGKRYRTNGPAYIEYYENGNIQYELYWVDGKLHRTDGPAYIKYHENGNIYYEEYYINGKRLTKEEFEAGNYSKTNNIVSNNKCECGAHSIGSSSHSTWCPLYNKR